MKRLFLIIIFSSCFYNFSFAQNEKFFSLEANANVQKPFFQKKGSIGYEAALIPAFTINRFKFNIGIMYSFNRYYEYESGGHYNPPIADRYFLYNINIPIIINYNLYSNKNLWLNCFIGTNISKFLYAEQYNYLRDFSYKIEGEKNTWSISSYRFGIEFSILAYENLKLNIAPFAHLNFFNEYEVLKTQTEPPKTNAINTTKWSPMGYLSFGISLGVEYMFKFKKD
ncbi:MAG: hypothetical protein LBM96_12695 [Methanobrevibacter sp.]|jgi:hypothetical protein|nr:hypothetical protein [Candidatus Methanoflexus mossambicus]